MITNNCIYNHKKFEQLMNKIRTNPNFSAIQKHELELKRRDMIRVRDWLLWYDVRS